MANITFIIPLHEYNDTVKGYLEKAFKSLKPIAKDEKVVLIGPNEVISKAKSLYKEKNISLIENDETDVYKQINKAAFNCTTPYFSVLEYDDEYLPFWKKTALEYAAAGDSVLLPINIFVKEDGENIGFGNELAWSSSFANEEGAGIGFIDIDCLNTYMDFNVTGGLIKTEDFISAGGLKPSLKIAAWYEFLLRMNYTSHDVYVFPKAAYKHTVGREGSYSVVSKNAISQEEGSWLINTAKQEYFFKEDRNKTFEGETPSEA